MVVETQEVQSAKDKVLTRDDVLRIIPGRYIDSVLYRGYLDRELVLGVIGDRGGGKSATCAVLGIVIFMMSGKPVWSNMTIKLDLEIDDAMARENGLNYGGVVHYESLPLEKEALLKLDDRYRKGCLVIEEINVQYSNVRRFMTNTNINFNEVCQQLRKFQTSLFYNVIDEMFIDSQLRALSDIFISTYDTAFDLDSLIARKQTGLDFHWKVFPISGYLQGQQAKYVYTKKTLSAYFHFGPWRGVFDTWRHQEKGIYSRSTKDLNAELSIESSPETLQHNKEWSWLETKIITLRNNGVEHMEGWELAEYIGCSLTDRIKTGLRACGVAYDRFTQSYRINTFKLERETAPP